MGTGLLMILNAVLMNGHYNHLSVPRKVFCQLILFLMWPFIKTILKMHVATSKSWLWLVVFYTVEYVLYDPSSFLLLLLHNMLVLMSKSPMKHCLHSDGWYADVEPKWCWFCGNCLIVHFSMEANFKAMFCKESVTDRNCGGTFYARRWLVTNHRCVLLFQKQQLHVVVRQVSINPSSSAPKRKAVFLRDWMS